VLNTLSAHLLQLEYLNAGVGPRYNGYGDLVQVLDGLARLVHIKASLPHFIPKLKWLIVCGIEILHPMYLLPSPDQPLFERILASQPFIPTLFDWHLSTSRSPDSITIQDQMALRSLLEIPQTLHRVLDHENVVSREIRVSDQQMLLDRPKPVVHHSMNRVECWKLFVTGDERRIPADIAVLVKCTSVLLKYGLRPNTPSLLQLCGEYSMLKLLLQNGILARRQNGNVKQPTLRPLPIPLNKSETDQLVQDFFLVVEEISISDQMEPCVRCLSEYQVDLNQRNALGRSWIQLAIASRNHKLVSILLGIRQPTNPDEFEIDINQADNFGTSVQQEALSSGFLEIVEAIQQRMKAGKPSANILAAPSAGPFNSTLSPQSASTDSQSARVSSRNRRNNAKWDAFWG
jgi:hypothetical protein